MLAGPTATNPRQVQIVASSSHVLPIAVQLDRGADCDDRMAVGLALHRAARVLEADDGHGPRTEWQ